MIKLTAQLLLVSYAGKYFYKLIWFIISITGQFGYASLYGELPEFELKRNENENIWLPSISSEKPWETIFSGSSHNLPPLTKLCGAFLEALLEKRTTAVE